jgi:hypothetical protein
MGARDRLARMIRGRAPANAALESLSADLRALQLKVAALETAQLDEFDKIRAAVADAVDDLVARVQAVDARSRDVS